MRIRIVIALFTMIAMLGGATGRAFADGTIVYEGNVHYGAAVIAAAHSGKNPRDLKDPAPISYTIKIKNGKMYRGNAKSSSILDSNSMQLTVMDPTLKEYAAVSTNDFMTQVLAPVLAPLLARPKPQEPLPPFLQSVATTFTSKKTGRTDTIQGVAAEETEMTLTMTMLLPPGMPGAAPAAPAAADGSTPPVGPAPSTILRVVIHIWNPTAADIQRVPAINEYTTFLTRTAPFATSMVDATEQALDKNPMLGGGLKPMLDSMVKDPQVLLRGDAEFYLPILAQLAPMLKGQNMNLSGVDLNAPLLEGHLAATEISSAAIDEAAFQVPSDYKEVSFNDLMHAMLPALSRSAQGGGMQPWPAGSSSAAPAQGHLQGGFPH